MELGPQTHIYLQSVLPWEFCRPIHMALLLSVLKKAKNGTTAIKKMELQA